MHVLRNVSGVLPKIYPASLNIQLIKQAKMLRQRKPPTDCLITRRSHQKGSLLFTESARFSACIRNRSCLPFKTRASLTSRAIKKRKVLVLLVTVTRMRRDLFSIQLWLLPRAVFLEVCFPIAVGRGKDIER